MMWEVETTKTTPKLPLKKYFLLMWTDFIKIIPNSSNKTDFLTSSEKKKKYSGWGGQKPLSYLSNKMKEVKLSLYRLVNFYK